ncbi:hypothetical protein RRF57_008731 [Xylaria bambusicola]|uniref:Uncharacterized protein n=1 Tax=Xylaria bambusicola TaxID=326684 RepID=A0AAN7Z799_9PEZI
MPRSTYHSRRAKKSRASFTISSFTPLSNTTLARGRFPRGVPRGTQSKFLTEYTTVFPSFDRSASVRASVKTSSKIWRCTYNVVNSKVSCGSPVFVFAVDCFSLLTAIYAYLYLTMWRPYPGWRKKLACVGPLGVVLVVVVTDSLLMRVRRLARKEVCGRGSDSQASIQGYAGSCLLISTLTSKRLRIRLAEVRAPRRATASTAPSEARPKPPAKTGFSRSPLMFRRGPAADDTGSDIAIRRGWVRSCI